jgi:muramoyltetrapeptide carboxypeptidase
MIKPRALVPGDRVAIVAPASSFRRDEFDEGVAEIERMGFIPVFDDSVFARLRHVAGPPELRADAIRRAWNDPSIRALIAVRGGYGSAQVLPLLSASDARRAGKVFVGYSDLTALLTFLTVHCGIVAFHGPMLAGRLSRGEDGYDRDSFVRAVCRSEPMGELAPCGLECVNAGEAAGVLLGGTLTQLTSSLGTPFAFDPPNGYILLLDEVGERPYKLDRMLTQLSQAGLLARARAIVVGQLPRCDEPSGDGTARAVVAELLAGFPGPVVIGFPTGHTTGAAVTLPLGVECRVIADRNPRLVIEEAAVS